MSDGLTKTARNSCSWASSCNDVPSSVIATKCRPAVLVAQLVVHAIEEVGVQAGRLGRAARLARHDEKGLLEVDALFHGGDRRRVGRVEHREVEAVLAGAEGERHDLRGEARAAHAEQHRVPQAVVAHLGHELGQAVELVGDVVEDGEPAQRVADHALVRGVAGLPERRVGGPEAGADALAVERRQAPLDGGAQIARPAAHQLAASRARSSSRRFSMMSSTPS